MILIYIYTLQYWLEHPVFCLKIPLHIISTAISYLPGFITKKKHTHTLHSYSSAPLVRLYTCTVCTVDLIICSVQNFLDY